MHSKGFKFLVRATLPRILITGCVGAMALPACGSSNGTPGGTAKTTPDGSTTGDASTTTPNTNDGGVAPDGAYIAEVDTVIVGGEISNDPMPETTNDPDVPEIVDLAVLPVDEDEAELELTVDSAYLPSEIHLAIAGVHVIVPVDLPPPTDYSGGSADGGVSDLSGYSAATCDGYSDNSGCFAPCETPCAEYRACDAQFGVVDDRFFMGCMRDCSFGANSLHRCLQDPSEKQCPSAEIMPLMPQSPEEFAAAYLPQHRFLCTYFVGYCAPPSTILPSHPTDPWSYDQSDLCEFQLREGLGKLPTSAPPRKRRKVRLAVLSFNVPEFTSATAVARVDTERSASSIVSDGFERADMKADSNCAIHVWCE